MKLTKREGTPSFDKLTLTKDKPDYIYNASNALRLLNDNSYFDVETGNYKVEGATFEVVKGYLEKEGGSNG